MTDRIDISICMVSLNCWQVLEDCLESLQATPPDCTYEVIVVDNNSNDGTPQKLREQYPYVRLVENAANVGFTRATNQGIEISTGRTLLWLNTDTILRPDSLPKLLEFLDTHPRAGIVGPKVLNADGTFQPQCKRGRPTPAASLYHMLGLDKFWPHSRTFGQYLLSYLSPDETAQVDALSGCCLLARREVWDKIGPLDENIFGFGEDIDWCLRAKDAGWEVWYYPGSEIVHLKGQGGVHSKPYHKIWGIHQAMWVIYCKHERPNRFSPMALLVGLGIAGSMVASGLSVFVRRTLLRQGRRPPQVRAGA